MKLLQDILYKCSIREVSGPTNIAIESITLDSRKAGKLSLFIAIKGTVSDGHDFIPQAIANGASAIICEQMPETKAEGISYITVENIRKAAARAAINFYDHPSSKLKLVGITGTNGKTTVASTLYAMFTQMGFVCGLLSTVKNKIGKETLDATHTTPDPVSLNALLHKMVLAGCKYAFMEVSSHALDQDRVEGLEFKGAVFTNLTHDHLDYHGSFDHYLAAKKRLFDQLKPEAFALINLDDKHGNVMLQNCKAHKNTYALRTVADFKGKIQENHITGLWMNFDGMEFHTPFAGVFNAYNLLAVYGTAVLLGQDKMNVLTIISNLRPVEGRFQLVRSKKGITGIIDYAHTPDALLNVLKTVKELAGNQSKVITVIGCGGNRDKEKRPMMAKVAADYSDKIILTSDNPRFEDPETILEEMKKGLDIPALIKTIKITDRREAIRTACSIAAHEDIILIAGKGHEKYQEVNGEKIHFDDLEELENEFKNLS